MLGLCSRRGTIRAGRGGPKGAMISAVAFTLFCLICTVFAFTRHPIWGIYFYLATTYVFPPGRWWGYIFGDLRWALIAAIVCAASVVFHRGKLVAKPTWFANPPTMMLIAYAVWMWVQTAWALDLNDHLKGCGDFSKCLILERQAVDIFMSEHYAMNADQVAVRVTARSTVALTQPTAFSVATGII